ncbi:hypothetical protein SERLA73DRAFT_162998 [Serpula lacrymans var. lacrymans S7.3]|uniref:F-box domain-containing protein n=2 Tax=Serpula lacrymans var. lacrymans TaxID=341189 RepID=F8QAZ8_SERL3|nr:uncharacterized protein SERLADRAFT_442688 [Serpula lacrymans var. lacrymans S7.9]EGN94384.1 hypothetical protein SERLA73DRAFT_162998 [Serpula lacrymans var. lacrymans S7.3]EGO19866.1 hypothetical protein SERLADRAFT_442688 [Serpula lacrymans var. lacrymans S7.9]
MHFCLQLPEILDVILEYALYENGRRRTDAVAAIASTCRTLSYPALVALWKEQTSLVPLLKCLPPDAWTIERPSTYNTFKGIFKLLRVPNKDSDWDRVLHYANLIRSLGSESTSPSSSFSRPFHVKDDVFSALRLYLPRALLLPNLKYFNRPIGGDDYDYIHTSLFYGPNLVSFQWTRVFQPVPIGDTVELLECLERQSSNLQTLAVQHFTRIGNNRPIFPQFWKVVGSFKHLQHLSCPTNSITFPLFNLYLLHLRNLQSLDLLLDGTSPLPLPTGSTVVFPFLAKVHVRLMDMDSLDPFTSLISSSPISDLKIVLDNSSSVITEEFFSSLQSPSLLAHMENLVIMSSIRAGPHSSILSCDILQPLLAFKNMRILALLLDCASGIDNSFVKEMAFSWTKLESLLFSPYSKLDECKVTLAGLIPFAEGCKRLTSLAMPIDGRISPDVDEMQDLLGPSANMLVSLDVGFSPIQDPIAVAHFLSRLFPNLIRIHAEGERTHVEQWKSVVRMNTVSRVL